MRKTETSRKVVTRSGRHVRYLYSSIKNDALVQCESRLELDAAMHFEFDPNVLRYREQPELVTYHDRLGRSRKYYPDFELTMADGTLVHVEVKPAYKLRQATLQERLEDIAARYARAQRPFQILTELDVQREPRRTNLERLSYHRRATPFGFELSSLLDRLSDKRRLTLKVVEKEIGNPKLTMRMIAAGYLICDLDKPIDDSTVLEIRRRG
ncbi:TnsA endonuclease N-terminal domain-containing protein [Burkholderia stagnalis]|uniref:TnsA endonuclease N-terminal domain-containing protein n=1 Tax=Burkholderia stagnalis TaxID=1503054 RepID=UPI0009C1A7A6|nr:TnsA endonuclease N-terminal domain-containing protein [Burkholderia stagnalis]